MFRRKPGRPVVRAFMLGGIRFGLGLASVFGTRVCPNLEPITSSSLVVPQTFIAPPVLENAETSDAPGPKPFSATPNAFSGR